MSNRACRLLRLRSKRQLGFTQHSGGERYVRQGHTNKHELTPRIICCLLDADAGAHACAEGACLVANGGKQGMIEPRQQPKPQGRIFNSDQDAHTVCVHAFLFARTGLMTGSGFSAGEPPNHSATVKLFKLLSRHARSVDRVLHEHMGARRHKFHHYSRGKKAQTRRLFRMSSSNHVGL